MSDKKSSIGIFDSGMGGISVLGDAIKMLPNESFIYFGDSINAPYGVKSKGEIRSLSENVCDFLVKRDVKAIVVACNTATSAAVEDIRQKYDIPIIGMEPALKPAVLDNQSKIAVMATHATLNLEKFNNLLFTYAGSSEVVKIPCPNLVELVEEGVVSGERAYDEIRKCLEGYDISGLTAIVLGCTHYVFLKKAIKDVLGNRISIYDGNSGTVKHLRETLIKNNLLNEMCTNSNVEIFNSKGNDMIAQSYKLLELYKCI